jgi:hypothetical protein
VTAVAIVLAAVAVVAVGTLVPALVSLRRAVRRLSSMETELESGRGIFADTVRREADARAEELERTLARSRADSISLLAEEERRYAEERRALVAERERAATAKLSEALTVAQQRIEQRISTWAADFERTQQSLAEELRRLGERQKKLHLDVDARIGSDTDALEAAGEEQRAALQRMREELARSASEVASAASAELEQHAAERRRALHEIADRLSRREHELTEQVGREANEAAEHLKSALADVERRHVEGLERVVSRASARYSEEVLQQFEQSARSAREDAARRLSRELDLAIERFTREAEGMIAERLTQAGDAAAARVEQRLTSLHASLDRQRDDIITALERHASESEQQMRDRLEALAADAEAERGILDARLGELSRRIDEALGRAQEKLAELESLRSS